jgi:hypothetical protein
MPSTCAARSVEDEYSRWGGHQPDRAERRQRHRLDQHARHVAGLRSLPGQEMAQRLRDRIARQQEVAEALAAALAVGDIDADAPRSR